LYCTCRESNYDSVVQSLLGQFSNENLKNFDTVSDVTGFLKSTKELLGRELCLAWEEACSHDFSVKSCRDVHILDS